jgi:hypothetical protein
MFGRLKDKVNSFLQLKVDDMFISEGKNVLLIICEVF